MVSGGYMLSNRVYNSLYIRTLLKQGAYGGKPVVKRALVVTPGSLVKVSTVQTYCTCILVAIEVQLDVHMLYYIHQM